MNHAKMLSTPLPHTVSVNIPTSVSVINFGSSITPMICPWLVGNHLLEIRALDVTLAIEHLEFYTSPLPDIVLRFLYAVDCGVLE